MTRVRRSSGRFLVSLTLLLALPALSALPATGQTGIDASSAAGATTSFEEATASGTRIRTFDAPNGVEATLATRIGIGHGTDTRFGIQQLGLELR